LSDNIIPYFEMCQRENAALQAGMNFGLGGNHSVILMSLRPNAPYQDRLEDDGTTLIYEGHDQPKSTKCPTPKLVDQPERRASGTLTQNGRFHAAAQAAKAHKRPPERVHVYEKIREGIWADNGVFHLVDSWIESDGKRRIFKFKLVAVSDEQKLTRDTIPLRARRRIIPTAVKLAVWKRDGGRCVWVDSNGECGATDELHFDHDLPYSKGGTSLTAANVQLLCARHNLQKRDQIK
jgi:5-methylcytosine-specific restriction endonuclease McrA